MTRYSISPISEIGKGNTFRSGVIIAENVKIGDNNFIGEYSVIGQNTIIGSNNYIGTHISIGGYPQHSRHKYELYQNHEGDLENKIEIGNENVIREFTTIHRPTLSLTKICDQCYIMAHCHIAHDVLLENNVILANSCDTGGHVRILEGANLGKAVQIHPRTIIGQYAMLGMGTIVTRHILPGTKVVGNPATVLGVNTVGLERNGFTSEEISSIQTIIESPSEFGAIMSKLSPRIVSMFKYFFKRLSEGRNAKTLPEFTIQ